MMKRKEYSSVFYKFTTAYYTERRFFRFFLHLFLCTCVRIPFFHVEREFRRGDWVSEWVKERKGEREREIAMNKRVRIESMFVWMLVCMHVCVVVFFTFHILYYFSYILFNSIFVILLCFFHSLFTGPCNGRGIIRLG